MGFPTTGILDDFNRANETLTAPLWTNTAFGDAATLSISGNQVLADANFGDAGLRQVYGPDCEFYCRVPTLQASGNMGISLRMAGLGAISTGYRLLFNPVAATWAMVRFDAGVQSTFASGSLSGFLAGEWIGFQAAGSIFSFWFTVSGIWSLAATAVDSTYNQSGYGGFRLPDTTIRIDDVGGGNSFLTTLDPQIQWTDLGPGDFGPTPFWTPPYQPNVFGQELDASSTTTASITNTVLTGLSATATTLSSFQIQVNKKLAATSTTTASFLKTVLKNLSATATATASIKNTVQKILSATATTTASMVRRISKLLSATSTTTATVSRQVNKSLSTTATTTATQQRQVNKPITGSSTSSALMQRKTLKNVVATVTGVASLAASKLVHLTLTAIATTTASVTTVFIAAGGAVVRKLRMMMGLGR